MTFGFLRDNKNSSHAQSCPQETLQTLRRGKVWMFLSPFVEYFRPIKSLKGDDSLTFAIICRIFHLIRYFFSSNWVFNQMMKICIFAKFPWQYLKCYESVSFPVKAHFICILKTKFRLLRIRNDSNRKYSFRFLFKPMVLVFGIIASVCSEWS